jgi:acetyl esterase/lipase
MPNDAGGGDGLLSEQARARLDRGVGDPPIALPDLRDFEAVARWRHAVHEAWGEGTEPGECEHVPIQIGGVECLSAGEAAHPVVIYFHGGGYALGSPGVAAPITARLARSLRVISVDYRLAPEHPFPAALEDAVAVYGVLHNQRPALAGDSAGGSLAVAVALSATARGLPRPSALALFCPHLDHADEPDAALASAYRGATPADHPLLSPVHADPAELSALPPTLLQTGTLDPLFAQAVRFARRARMAGRPLALDVWEGLWHTWHYHRELPEAHRALAEAAAFITANQ